jgi:hypothetical protein
MIETGDRPVADRRTEVSIEDQRFLINGRPTYKGRTWRGLTLEGLLMNSRMVQGIFDDLNPETRHLWAYPDTGEWDPDRNTAEFVEAMEEWHRHGLLGFTVNLQGGSPQGYSRIEDQVWENSAFEPSGDLRPAYMDRLTRILDRADELGMVPIVGLFYFGQDHRLTDEDAVARATDNAVQWLLEGDWRNVLVEINNECDVHYDHAILQPERVHELIVRAKSRSGNGRRLLVSTSYGGGTVPGRNVIETADFLLMHGNGVGDPERIRRMVEECRDGPCYRGQPVVFNEDDHFDFDQPDNNMIAAVSRHASWGYFDYRMEGEGLNEGYQSPPVNWGISSERKRGFFRLLAEMTGRGGEELV